MLLLMFALLLSVGALAEEPSQLVEAMPSAAQIEVRMALIRALAAREPEPTCEAVEALTTDKTLNLKLGYRW